MRLSEKATKDLREVFMQFFGADASNSFSDKELNTIGNLLLTILAESLKMKMNEEQNLI